MKVAFLCVLYFLCLRRCFVWATPLSIQTNLINFCDSEGILTSKDVALTEDGNSASKTVSLSPETFAAVCKLRISSPKTHVINMQFVESSNNLHRTLMFNNTERHPPCTMSIYLPDDSTRPFWEGDPCSQESLPDVDLLTSEFEVVWAPPPNPNHTKGRKFIITAIGKGGICKEPGQHTCMRIGRQPVFCITEKLICDGIQHCPKSSTKSDEAEDICRTNIPNQDSWEQLAQEFAVKILKKFKPPPDEMNTKHTWPKPKYDFTARETKKGAGNWPEWHLKKKETTTVKPSVPEEKPKQSDSVSSMLSKYGPWGYLMMGLLICGTVLMFCGLWECCFRRPKNSAELPNSTQPTTVLIINQGEEGPIVGPPNYDDLDEPPSYNTLFPNMKSNNTTHASNSEQDTNSINNSGTTSFYSAITLVGDASPRRSTNTETHIVQINRNNESSDDSNYNSSYHTNDTTILEDSNSDTDYGSPIQNQHIEET